MKLFQLSATTFVVGVVGTIMTYAVPLVHGGFITESRSFVPKQALKSPHDIIDSNSNSNSNNFFPTRTKTTPSIMGPSSTTKTTKTTSKTTTTVLYGLFDMFQGTDEDQKIPPELVKQITEAEANTQAGKNRSQRITIYGTICLISLVIAIVGNGIEQIITSVAEDDMMMNGAAAASSGSGSVGTAIDDVILFPFIQNNPVLHFIFLTSIGRTIFWVIGIGLTFPLESEMSAKRETVRQIYEEYQRRRKDGSAGGQGKARKNKKYVSKMVSGGKSRSKRLVAMSEVADLQQDEKQQQDQEQQDDGDDTVASSEAEEKVEEKKDDKGILGQMQDFYKKADSMAASQALLLNKQLEDAGVVEKITDETGFKVIGKEEAAKLQKAKNDDGGDDNDNDPKK